MKKLYTKIGDIFCVKIDANSKKYFQLIAFDLTQLNSDVIRAFKTVYSLNVHPDYSQITSDEIDFYAHCVTKWGVKMELWEKIGNSVEIGKLDRILFRGASDYGIRKGKEPVRVSDKWYVWRIGDKNFTHVGRLEGEYRKAEIGLVMNPRDIVDRMTTGEYRGPYPTFD